MKFSGETTELGVGARKWLESSSEISFYVEGGIVSISAKTSGKLTNTNTPVTVSDSGSTTGFWFGGGLSYQVSDTVSIGAIARISQGELSLFDVNAAVGGTIIALTLQYHSE